MEKEKIFEKLLSGCQAIGGEFSKRGEKEAYCKVGGSKVGIILEEGEYPMIISETGNSLSRTEVSELKEIKVPEGEIYETLRPYEEEVVTFGEGSLEITGISKENSKSKVRINKKGEVVSKFFPEEAFKEIGME